MKRQRVAKHAPQPVAVAPPAPRLRLFALLLLLGGGAFAATYWFVRATPPRAPAEDMVWIAGGEFEMGTDGELGWADERPAHRVRVNGFWIDRTEVTNAAFSAFVAATGYVTTAEKPPLWEEMREATPARHAEASRR